MADRAFNYLREFFWDAEYGGYYLSVDATGRPLNTKKLTYAQAFALYGLAEYARATGRQEALPLVRDQHNIVERAREPLYGGYLEAFTRDWETEPDMRLGDSDPNEKKSMNTHLHILEAYTNAFAVSPRPEIRASLALVADILADKVLDPRTAHFRLYFDEDWGPKSDVTSYGHDVEGSWLQVEAAEILGTPDRLGRARAMALRMVDAVIREGVAADGSLLYESHGSGAVDDSRHWWPQAEAVVAFVNAFQLSGDRAYLNAAARTWGYIDRYLVDHRYGEWFWRVDRNGVPDNSQKKVDTWKCPYHNSRACLEVIDRLTPFGVSAPAARQGQGTGGTGG
jgi:mannobiose 2-epimerase